MFELIARYHQALIDGALVTIQLAALVWGIGIALGLAVGLFRAMLGSGRESTVYAVASLALGSVPVLVYLFWAYYPLQSLLHLSIAPFVTAAIVLSLYNALTVSEIALKAMQSLPVAYRLSARTIGIRPAAYFRHILAPLLLRAMLPGLLSSQVTALHLTLFASLISVDELFRVTQRINAIEYNAVGVFSLLAAFYFFISFPLLLLSRWFEHNVSGVGLER